MEDLGACYAAVLHEPAVRRGLVAGSPATAPFRRPLRHTLARALRALATRLEPVAEPGVSPVANGGAPLAPAP